jgi:hypothetical protein
MVVGDRRVEVTRIRIAEARPGKALAGNFDGL